MRYYQNSNMLSVEQKQTLRDAGYSEAKIQAYEWAKFGDTESVVPEDDTAALMDPEVTKGLEQLLSEWEIFKSSGFLGFGAGGIEHPIYKKLAALPVVEVISGRWEGVDPKIIANIKEYMDGWKQELGIEANLEESFETYLRRAIAEKLSIMQERVAEPVAA